MHVFIIPIALLFLGCNPTPATHQKPTASPAVPEVPQVTQAPGAAARPQNAPQQTAPPKEETPPPSLPTFQQSMLTPEGLWHTEVEELELVKGAIKLSVSGADAVEYGCEWEPLQSAESYEWTWVNCIEEAFALFRVKQDTWTLLKVPKHFMSQIQEGCVERYTKAREQVAEDGEVWLIWSWEYQAHLEHEGFSDDCDETGACISGRTGDTELHETTQSYDVIMKPDKMPSLVLRSRKNLVTYNTVPAQKKGSRLDVEVTYVGQEVQATHRLAQIKNDK